MERASKGVYWWPKTEKLHHCFEEKNGTEAASNRVENVWFPVCFPNDYSINSSVSISLDHVFI